MTGKWTYPRSRSEHSAGIPPPTKSAQAVPEPHFKDDQLEKLIARGKFDDARAYQHKMIRLCREMKARQKEASYRAYDKKIDDAESIYDSPRTKAEKWAMDTKAKDEKARDDKIRDDDVRMEFLDD